MGIRETLHRGKPARPADPNHPHEFKRLSDNWVGHGVAPLDTIGAMGSPAITGAAFQFTGQQCAICRRTPEDPIHFPVQD